MTTARGTVIGVALAAAAAATLGALPARAHHSFAAYDMEKTKVFTGVVTRINPDANHLQIFFAPMNDERKNVIRGEDGKPIIWAVEMMGSAQSAAEGISVNTFPPGTIFSIGLHPLRDGQHAGTRGRGGTIYKCPPKTPPAPGKHCDSVPGNTAYGTGGLPQPKE
ncbi:MAG TPA: DUF6152 family protein [Steroidobacteraceae bacterium]|jgi:hypothetical protein|nr:DUF6152 family protein [Steroidobacteraceae bacterium]